MIIPSGMLSLIVLASIHFFANQSRLLGWIWHGRFLSFAAGLSFSYIFVDLLPSLEKGQPILKHAFDHLVPYLDKHTYVIALFGVLFYYGIHTQSETKTRRKFWISLAGYVLFNFFVGASLSDSTNPEIQPLLLFTIAMGMHYFVQDHNASMEDTGLYNHQARWVLVAALFAGYAVESYVHIPNPLVAIAVSFLAGGVFLNVLRYELPKREQIGYLFFLTGALLYTGLLLSLGK
jgi:hypothetical protein